MLRRHLAMAAAAGLTALTVLTIGAVPAFAQTAPSLGTAANFAVLAGSTVTNTGSSVLTGEVGVSPGTAITGFPPGVIVSGTSHSNDASAIQAQIDLTAAYNSASAQAPTQTLTGQDLGGLTLTAGVYRFATSAQLTGTLTLNAQGNSAAVFIFQIGSTLTTASGSTVRVINSGNSCNVFFVVGSSATLGTSTTFVGDILALTSITLNTSATVTGRALARNGAVTLDTNTVNRTCVASAAPVCPVISLSPATLPNGAIGTAYSQTLTGSGGTAPYAFTVTSGTLPAGLTLTTAGVLAGTPTTAGTSTVTIRGTDANGCFAAATYVIVIPAAVCPVISLLPATLPNGAIGTAYSQTLTGSGGTAPYAFTVTSGTLPAGLTLTTAGLLAGTPTTAGTSTVTIRGADANGCFAVITYVIVIPAAVCPVISLLPATLPNGAIGTAYSQTLTGSGGTGPYTFTVTSGTLPAGLTLTTAGLLAGTPTTAGTSTVTIRGADANGCFAAITYTIIIPVAVPTLPVLAMILLAALLGTAGVLAMRRGRVA